MAKQQKLPGRSILLVAIAVVLFLGADLPAFAQAGYKLGEFAEIMAEGEWVRVKIIEAKDGQFKIHYEIAYYRPDIWVEPRYLRPIKAVTPANSPNNPADPTQDQTNENTSTKLGGGTPATPNSIAARYGSREPRTCSDQTAPSGGAITAELAKKYFICKAEGISGNLLYMVENVKLEVGGPIPFNRDLGVFDSVNVRVPLYPIRGSFLQYQCKNLLNEYVGPPDTNCNTNKHPKATGYCHKTTFGDWSCYMADRFFSHEENYRTRVAPPKAEGPR